VTDNTQMFVHISSAWCLVKTPSRKQLMAAVLLISSHLMSVSIISFGQLVSLQWATTSVIDSDGCGATHSAATVGYRYCSFIRRLC